MHILLTFLCLALAFDQVASMKDHYPGEHETRLTVAISCHVRLTSCRLLYQVVKYISTLAAFSRNWETQPPSVSQALARAKLSILRHRSLLD